MRALDEHEVDLVCESFHVSVLDELSERRSGVALPVVEIFDRPHREKLTLYFYTDGRAMLCVKGPVAFRFCGRGRLPQFVSQAATAYFKALEALG